MRKGILLLLVFVTAGMLSACKKKDKSSGNSGEQNKKEQAFEPKLDTLWKTDKVLKIPESVYYDGKRRVIYVSNIKGKSNQKDGEGFISKLSPEGKVLNKKWVTGLDAPKGMGVFDGKLYVANIDEVVRIDIEGGSIEQRFPLVGAKFANDIDINAEGTVFISDMRANKIYRLKDNVPELWLDDAMLQTPNGLYAEDDALLIGISGSVLKADYQSGELTKYIANTGSIDGLEKVNDEWFIISDWLGHVNLIHPSKEKILVLDTTPGEINAADIDFDINNQKLYVPTFNDNRVMAYKLKH